ncbi:MAG: YfcE family phosphodiesterase [bacterium]|nr:YfcE family phosphodiesterase [bacterium]
MKKVAVISDTHGNSEALNKMKGVLSQESITDIIHLGDNYVDADLFINNGINVLRVPGVWSSFYQHPYIDNRVLIEIEGWKFFLSHTISSHYNDLEDDLKPEKIITDRKCDIYLYGHTHVPEIKKDNGLVMINPGHLKKSDNRGFPHTYAVLCIEKDIIQVKILTLLENREYLKEIIRKG